MSTLQSEVYDAFRSLGVTEEKAMKAAQALGQRDLDVGDLKRDVSVLKWATTANTALLVAVLVKLFIQ